MTRGKRGDRTPWACEFKAAKGRWIHRYYDAQGGRQDEYVPKEVASTAEDRTRARHYAQKWFRAYSKETKDLERGKAAPEPPKVLTLRKLSKDWLRPQERTARSTAHQASHLPPGQGVLE